MKKKDIQQDKVYEWEQLHRDYDSNHILETYLTLDQVQELCDKIWARQNYDKRNVPEIKIRNGKGTCYYKSTSTVASIRNGRYNHKFVEHSITLRPLWGSTPWTVMHEMTHALLDTYSDTNPCQNHGAEFMACMCELLEWYASETKFPDDLDMSYADNAREFGLQVAETLITESNLIEVSPTLKSAQGLTLREQAQSHKTYKPKEDNRLHTTTRILFPKKVSEERAVIGKYKDYFDLAYPTFLPTLFRFLDALPYTYEFGRGTYWLGEEGLDYRYTNRSHVAQGWQDYRITHLTEIMRELTNQFKLGTWENGELYNHLLINQYLPNQKLNMHRDNEPTISGPLASFTVGASARFTYGLTKSIREGTHISLGEGDILIGNQDFFDNYYHSVAKPQITDESAVRYNLTWRTVKEN